MNPTDSKGKEIKAEYLFGLLTRDGSSAGKDAFVELCQLGCDSRIVGEALVYLHSESSFTITSTPEERIERYRQVRPSIVTDSLIEIEKQRGTDELEIYLRPMDSLEAALGKFKPRQLERLREKCKKLAEQLEAFHSTRLVRHGMIDGEFPDNRPVELPYLLRLYADQFLPLLIAKTKHIGPKYRPDYTRLLTKIYNHIHEETGGWQDRLVADVLNELFGYPADELKTPEALKAWRSEHGLVEKLDRTSVIESSSRPK